MADTGFDPTHKRRGTPPPNLRGSPVRETVIKVGSEFRDVANRKELEDFVKKHGSVLQTQDDEIESKRVAREQELSEEFTPEGINPSPRLPSREEYEEEDIEEEPIQNTKPRHGLDNLPNFEDLSHLPPDLQKRIREARELQENFRKGKLQKTEKLRPSKADSISNEEDDDEGLISNASTGGPVAPPQIKPSQMRKKIESELAEKLKKNLPLTEDNRTAPRFTVGELEEGDYARIELVSGYYFYTQTDCQIRKFNLQDILRLHTAKKNQSISAYVDAIGATLKGISIRDLTIPDLRHVLYWHRFNSYTQTPWIITWTSKYGNENIYTISDSTIKYQMPQMSREEYFGEWYSKGYMLPTFRDQEVFYRENLNPEELFLYEKAQYFRPEGEFTIQGKIDAMAKRCSKDLTALENLKTFVQKSNHAVIELIDLTDAKFNPREWTRVLKNQIEILKNEREIIIEDGDALKLLAIEDQITEIEEEIEDINGKLERKEEVLPDVESVRLNTPILDFFPEL